MVDVAAVSIGGMTVLSIHMVIMAMIRRVTTTGTRIDRWFDWLNWPVAFGLMVIANPPWPWWQAGEWQAYVGMSMALAALASVTAKKTGDAKPRDANGGDA